MACNGQVCEEKPLPARQAVDPCQHPCHRGGFVHSEAPIVIAADIAGILPCLVPATVDNRLPPQVPEASRVEHRGAVTSVCPNSGHRTAFSVFILLPPAIDSRERGT